VPFDAYDKEDVAGLLKDRLVEAKEHLEDALEAVRAVCGESRNAKGSDGVSSVFLIERSGNAKELKANEPQRLSLYNLTQHWFVLMLR